MQELIPRRMDDPKLLRSILASEKRIDFGVDFLASVAPFGDPISMRLKIVQTTFIKFMLFRNAFLIELPSIFGGLKIRPIDQQSIKKCSENKDDTERVKNNKPSETIVFYNICLTAAFLR